MIQNEQRISCQLDTNGYMTPFRDIILKDIMSTIS